ncbi:MAG: ABC transporter permease [bacterium]
MGPFLIDLRHAVRSLLRQPVFTAAALLCLALGIGANTAVFTLVNGALLRPMPYEEPGRLVFLSHSSERFGDRWSPHSYIDLTEWQERQDAFEGIAAFRNVTITMRGDEHPQRLTGMGITHGLFDVLGVHPALGRTFSEEEAGAGGPPVALLTWGLWQREFGEDPDIVGSRVELQGETHTVVGVMPEGFRFPWWSDVYVPLQEDAARGDRGVRNLRSVARLADGVSLEQARSAMEGVLATLESEYPSSYSGVGIYMDRWQDQERSHHRDGLLVLMAAVGLVLLIACVNVAGILMARSAGRGREMAIRTSLGAGRKELIRQLLAESLVLAGLGAAAGLGLGVLGRDLLLAAAPMARPFWMDFGLDPRVTAFVVGISVLTALLFGTAPALHSSRTSPAELLRSSGDRGASGRSRWGGMLTAGEVALALALLLSAGAMLKGLDSLLEIDPGFDPEGVLTFRTSLTPADYPERGQRQDLVSRLMEELDALPGTLSVGAVQSLPLGGDNWGNSFYVEGTPEPEPGKGPVGNYRVVQGDYFRTAGIPLLAGRTFTRGELDSGSEGIIINQALAREYFPDGDPLGRRIKLGTAQQDVPWRTIIGVAGDVKHSRIDDSEASPGFYLPYGSHPLYGMTFLLRSEGDPTLLTTAVREVMGRAAPSVPIYSVQTFKEYHDFATGQPRFYTQLMGAFSAAALLLALLGVAGVMSFLVRRRMRDVGIRTALGASPGDVMREMLSRGMRPVVAGTAAGALLGYALLRWLASTFYGISPADPTVYAALGGTLLAASFLAVWIPARRALRADPVRVLREE